ncbi:response regulator [Bradyrhizobium sp. 21]|uniref:response regulator n=1 Tax=Bradyrhizobium sp. 21 TaxID=2782666 RepID=UPI001FFB53DA|nr:response regulator [Bradyrhizobium sp. 21]MCK1388158.1 response regulator [Bradyrhizobium sp. 21]
MEQSGPFVLVVEDEHAIQGFVEDVLNEAGFGAVSLSSGEEALTILKADKDKFSALLTDVNLAGRSTGWDVAMRVRELKPEMPVIYMSGSAGEQWPAHGVPGSILLIKPFAPAQLVTAVSQLLNVGSSKI